MAQTRVLLGRVTGAGAALPGLAPEDVLTAAGAGTSEYGTKRQFTLNVNVAQDSVARFALRSTDFQPIHFCMRFFLGGLTPSQPFRKQVLINMSGLWQREFYRWTTSGYDEQNSRSWFRSIPIYVNESENQGWIGRENTVRAQAMRKDHGVYTAPHTAMEWWRLMLQRKYGAQPITAHSTTSSDWKTTWIAGQRYRVRLPWMHFGQQSGIATQELYNNNMASQYPWLLTYGRSLRIAARESQGMSGRNQHAGASVALLRVTFEYYGPEVKTVTYDLFHHMPGNDT